MSYRQVDWKAKEKITSQKMNQMAENTRFLRDRKVEGGILNMDSSHQPRSGQSVIRDNLVMYVEYRDISPGGTTTTFSKRINFPKDFFDPEFLPVVIATIGTNQGLKKVTHIIRDITSAGFTVVIREHEDKEFKPSQSYFLSFCAIGVKL